MAKAKTKAAVKSKPAKAKAAAAKPPAKAARTKTAKPAKVVAAKKTTVAAAKQPRKAVAVTVSKAEPLTLPVAKRVEPPKAAPAASKPLPTAERADLPPEAGFTILVDGHFKKGFDELKQAKAAASELKERFPMLRVEIYDGARKTRTPVEV